MATLLTLGAEPRAGTTTLVCVPHAGGSAVAFRHWQRVCGAEGLSVRAVHWDPGADSTIGSRAVALAAALGELSGPWILLGHSLGALIAVETARRLEERGGPRPERVVLCAATPPGHPRGFPAGVRGASEASLAQYVRGLGGTAEEILSDPEFGPLLLAQLRADLDMIERHDPAGRSLEVPVSAYAGATDAAAPPASLTAWKATAPSLTTRVFPGGHFFPHERPAEVCRAIIADRDARQPGRSAV